MIWHLRNRLQQRDDRGSSAVEYAILASLIAIVIIASVTFFGTRTNDMYQHNCESIANAQGGTC